MSVCIRLFIYTVHFILCFVINELCSFRAFRLAFGLRIEHIERSCQPSRTGTCCETDARATSCNHIFIVQGDFVDVPANMRAPSCGPVQRSERKRLL